MRLPPAPKKPDPVEALLARIGDQTVPEILVGTCLAMPLGVMVRVLLDRILDDEFLQALMKEYAPKQYTRELTRVALVRLMLQISAGSRASLFAAYQADQSSESPVITTS